VKQPRLKPRQRRALRGRSCSWLDIIFAESAKGKGK
jgi:hypothetical protein